MVGKENREAWGWLQTRERQALTSGLAHPHAASGTGGEASGGRRRPACAYTGTHALMHRASRCRTHVNGPGQCSSEMRRTGASASEHPAPASAGSRAKSQLVGGVKEVSPWPLAWRDNRQPRLGSTLLGGPMKVGAASQRCFASQLSRWHLARGLVCFRYSEWMNE